MRLTIEKLIYGGDGLARLPADDKGRGKAVFLPFVLPGEEVEARILEERPGFARARAEQLLKASDLRVQPECKYFQNCGGCHYQHTTCEEQIELKASILRENLRRITKVELKQELQTHPSPPWHYRNRARLRLRNDPDFAVGYYKFGSHELLPVEQCPISSPLINQAITALWKLAKVPDGVLEIEFFANADDDALLAELYCPPGAKVPAIRDWVKDFQSAFPQAVGVTVFETRESFGLQGPRLLETSGAGDLSYQVGSEAYRVSAGAFFQVNRFLTPKLVEIATQGLSGKLALDLYAGAGLFSKVLARSFAQVIAVEASPISQRDLVYNSPANVKAILGTSEQYLGKQGRQLRPDLVVVDPPRSGLGDQVVRSLAGLTAARVVYVSCDPATLSRDLGGLMAAGYRVEQAHLIDLFPQTYHLESVFHLIR